VTRPRLRHVEQGEVTLQSYARMRAPGAFSEELLEKILCGVSAQKYADTVLQAAGAFGVSSSTVSRKLVELTAAKLKAFQERSLADFTPCAMFLDTIHRNGEAFLVALGVDMSGQKMALGFWQGSSENHELCASLFSDLERRGAYSADPLRDGRRERLAQGAAGALWQEVGTSTLCHSQEPEPAAASSQTVSD